MLSFLVVGAAPFPWHSPCALILMLALANNLESPNAIWKEKIIPWIILNIVLLASFDTLHACITIDAIACDINHSSSVS